jgi:hypothetical protein
MMVPLPVIATVASSRIARWLPRRVLVYELSAAASFGLFIVLYEELSADFTDHFLIPGLVLIVVLIATSIGVTFDYFRSRRSE